METNEIIVNEDVIETTEESATAGFIKDYKMELIIGLAIGIGLSTYKHVVKPMLAKYKAKKEQQSFSEDFEDIDCVECNIVDENEVEESED